MHGCLTSASALSFPSVHRGLPWHWGGSPSKLPSAVHVREEAPTSAYPDSQVKLTEVPTVTVGEEREESPWRRGGGASHNTAGGPVKISKSLGSRLGVFGRVSVQKKFNEEVT